MPSSWPGTYQGGSRDYWLLRYQHNRCAPIGTTKLLTNLFIADLDNSVQQLVQQGLRPNTRRSYGSAQRMYFSFCREFNLNPVPADENQLLRFIAYAHRQSLSPATIGVYVAGVASLHTLQGLPPPVAGHRVKVALKAVQEACISTNKKAPISYKLLVQMCMPLDSWETCLLWKAMITLGFYGALRGSEYAAVA